MPQARFRNLLFMAFLPLLAVNLALLGLLAGWSNWSPVVTGISAVIALAGLGHVAFVTARLGGQRASEAPAPLPAHVTMAGQAVLAASTPILLVDNDGVVVKASEGYLHAAADAGLPPTVIGRRIADVFGEEVRPGRTESHGGELIATAVDSGMVVEFTPAKATAAGDIAPAIGTVLTGDAASLDGAPEIASALAATAQSLRVFADEASDVLNGLARGDTTVRVTGRHPGMLGQLALQVNESVDGVARVLRQVEDGVGTINRSTSEIATTARELATRTEQQASSLEETAAAMEQIAGTAKNSAESAERASKLASTARESADHGGGIVASAIEAMGKIEESSGRITQIVGLIDDIAFQTNLLALNAAVEAARAGEAGKGFAVVASEVRSLASRTSQASKEIKDLIVNSRASVTSGVELVRSTEEELSKIVNYVGELDRIMSEIAIASRQQAEGISEVARAVSHMDEITQQNAALVEKTSAALGEAQRQVSELDSALQGHGGVRAVAAGAPAPAVTRSTPARPVAPPPPAPARAPFSSAARTPPAPVKPAAASKPAASAPVRAAAASASAPAPVARPRNDARSMQDKLNKSFTDRAPAAKPAAAATVAAVGAGSAAALLVHDDEWAEF